MRKIFLDVVTYNCTNIDFILRLFKDLWWSQTPYIYGQYKYPASVLSIYQVYVPFDKLLYARSIGILQWRSCWDFGIKNIIKTSLPLFFKNKTEYTFLIFCCILKTCQKQLFSPIPGCTFDTSIRPIKCWSV